MIFSHAHPGWNLFVACAPTGTLGLWIKLVSEYFVLHLTLKSAAFVETKSSAALL